MRVNDLLAVVDQLWLGAAIPLVSLAAHAVPRVVAPDRVPPAVLDAVDQCWAHLLATVGERGVGGHHPEQRGLAGAE